MCRSSLSLTRASTFRSPLPVLWKTAGNHGRRYRHRGKTSVASFVRQIWAFAGHAAAQIGTTGVIAPGREDYGALTTPDPVTLHALLAELAAEGVTHAAMEASSHGLDQRRLDGVKLAAASFTNLGRDHMDYHPTIEDYMAAKMRLFDTLMEKARQPSFCRRPLVG